MFKSERHNLFTKEINSNTISLNDYTRMQSINLMERYGTSKDLVSEKEEIKCNNIIKRFKKMINFGDVTNENIKKHKLNWRKTPDYPYTILIIVG